MPIFQAKIDNVRSFFDRFACWFKVRTSLLFDRFLLSNVCLLVYTVLASLCLFLVFMVNYKYSTEVFSFALNWISFDNRNP